MGKSQIKSHSQITNHSTNDLNHFKSKITPQTITYHKPLNPNHKSNHNVN